MSDFASRIEGSVIVVGLDVSGASVVVPQSEGRQPFIELGWTEDAVFLVDDAGQRHLLEGADPTVAERAMSQSVVVVREMSLDGICDDLEYPVALHEPAGGLAP